MRCPKGFQPTSPYCREQFAMFAGQILERVGGERAWRLLGPSIREAFIEAQAYHVAITSLVPLTADQIAHTKRDIGRYMGEEE